MGKIGRKIACSYDSSMMCIRLVNSQRRCLDYVDRSDKNRPEFTILEPVFCLRLPESVSEQMRRDVFSWGHDE